MLDVAKTAAITDDGMYRYALTRSWGLDNQSRWVNFIMLNPSTADAQADDPTIRRCMGFARRWGYEGMCVTNLYAYRATKPVDLWKAEDPVGPLNKYYLYEAALMHDPVAAWGANARRERVTEVMEQLGRFGWDVRLQALGITKEGHPRHPLYVRADAPLVPWVWQS